MAEEERDEEDRWRTRGLGCAGEGDGRVGDGRKKCSQWDDKSNFRSDCTESRGPLLLFICKAGLNYGGGKEAAAADGSCGPGRAIVLLADRKHHCTTTAVSSSSHTI